MSAALMTGVEGTMGLVSLGLRLLGAIVILAGAAAPVRGQPQVDVVHSFVGGGPAEPETPLLRASDGNFYGTSIRGGLYNSGTVFRMTPAGVVTVMHSFRPFQATDGAYPSAGLIQATDGNFYGTTRGGGAGCGGSDCGTIFKMTPEGTVTVLHAFTGGSQGASVDTPLTQGTDGHLYGTSASAGVGYGMVFRVTTAGVFTVLHTFPAGGIGTPRGALRQATDGNFYGAALTGPSGNGAVFRMTPGGTVSLLYAFSGGSAGQNPAGVMQAADGNFYGTTWRGGAFGSGVIFRITPGGSHATLHSFSGEGYGAEQPPIQGADGSLYGTTGRGGVNDTGTVYRLTLAGAFSVIRTFSGGLRRPVAGLVQAPDGSLYGTTTFGPASSGTVFRIAPDGAFSVVNLVGGGGSQPMAGLILGVDGRLLGATESGGSATTGTLFELDSSGVHSEIHSFPGAPGPAYSTSDLVAATDGNYYGTTWAGGTWGRGTVFKMSPSGSVTLVHSFGFGGVTGAPANPRAGLVQGSDGHLYGTTFGGGASDIGTIFRISLAGAVTVLHSFSANGDGYRPYGPLLEASDGNFYGLNHRIAGPTGERGGIFRVTPGGAYSVVHAFAGSPADGDTPWLGVSLIQASDGYLYGTTSYGGSNMVGVVFRSTLAGTVSLVHSFGGGGASASALYPASSLVQGSDGALYGTTTGGSQLGISGKVYRATLQDQFTVISTLTGMGTSTQEVPTASALTQGLDGNLYGMTTAGGAYGIGTIYRANIDVAPAIRFHPTGQAVSPGQPVMLRVVAVGTGPLAYQWYQGASGSTATPMPGATASSLSAPATNGAASYWVRVSNAYGSVDSRAATISPVPFPSGLVPTSIVGNRVTLDWTAPSGGLTPSTYILEGGMSPGQTLASIQTGGPATTFTFVAPSGAFYVRVHAVQGAIRTGPSNEVRIFVNVPTPPSPPANLLGLVDGASVALSWTNSFEGGAPTGFELHVSGAAAGTLSLPVSESFVFNGVPAGTYTLALRAVNSTAASGASNSVTLTFPSGCSGVPGVPTRFNAVKTGSTVSVSWSPPSSGPAVTGYRLLVRGTHVVDIPTTTRALAGTVGPGRYVLSVASTNACGVGAATPVQTIDVP